MWIEECPLNTIQQVVYQTGQYSPTFNSNKWAAIEPNEQCLRLAERLLQGERFVPRMFYTKQAGRKALEFIGNGKVMVLLNIFVMGDKYGIN